MKPAIRKIEKIQIDAIDKTDVTWENFSDQVKIKITNKDTNLILNLGTDAARQLKQALSKAA